MSYGFERLKEIGIQRINKETHISVANLKLIMSADFDQIPKVQLSGFISILEREYNLDLSNLRADALDHRVEKNIVDDQEENIFTPEDTTKKLPKVYIIILLILAMAIAAVFTLKSEIYQENNETLYSYEEENNKIENLQDDLKALEEAEIISSTSAQILQPEEKIKENNNEEENKVTKEEPETVVEEIATLEEEKTQNPQEIKEFEVLPKSRVWVGYIDLTNNKRKQKIISKPITLDGTKEWLFLFGHGNVEVKVGEEYISFQGKKSLRFHYKNGKITKITSQEFKELNNGHKW